MSGLSLPGPLVIEVTVSGDEARYSLDEPSMRRVCAVCVPLRPTKYIVVSSDTIDEFVGSWRDTVPHMILATVGLRLGDVIALGGVRVKNVMTGEIIQEWPQRPRDNGEDGACPQLS